MLNSRAIELLAARGLDPELLMKLGVESSTRLRGECIAIPYVKGGVVVNHKYRTLGDDKAFAQDEGAVKCFWNYDVITDETLAGFPLIITEGEMDGSAALQAGFPRVVSAPDGAPKDAIGEDDTGSKYSYVRDAKQDLDAVREIIIATDGDGPGINLMNDLAIRLGRARCKWIRYPKGCKDLNDALRLYGVKGVQAAIGTAQWFKVTGVFRMSELPPAPDFPAMETGLIDAHYKIRMGDFSVVTGIPSHGKSSFVNDFVCRATKRYGWPVCFGSFEQHPQIDHRRNLRRWFCGHYPDEKWTAEHVAEADAWIDAKFSFIVPDEDKDADLAWVLERCAAAVVQYGAKIVVIDPWNELDHVRPGDMSLTEYVGFAIRQFKKFARKYQIHLIVVAHPAKMRKNEDGQYPIPSLYDISDSAHWYNKADVGVVVHREDADTTLIRVAKSRYHEIIGAPGDERFWFNSLTGRYEAEVAAGSIREVA